MNGNPNTPEERITYLETSFSSLRDDVNQVRSDVGGLSARITAWMDEQSKAKQVNWYAIIGAFIAVATFLLTIVGGGWMLMQSNVQAEVTPIQSQVDVNVQDLYKANEALKAINNAVATLQSQASRSEEDRVHLNADLSAIDSRLDELTSSQRSAVAEFKAQGAEIETQIKGLYDIGNLRDAHNRTIIALIWKKQTGEDFPHFQFYPQPKVMPGVNTD